MVAPTKPPIDAHEARAYCLASEIRDQAFAVYSVSGGWKRTSIASVLGAYATQVVDYLAAVPLTGEQKRKIALAGGRLLISFLLAQKGIGLLLGAMQLVNWLEALIEITCSEGTPT